MGNKKAVWCVQTASEQKKGGAYLCESKLILRFCKSLITKHSHEDTGIKAKNSVLKQAKMVSILAESVSHGLKPSIILIEIKSNF